MEIDIDLKRLIEEPGPYVSDLCAITHEERQPGALEATMADQTAMFSYVVAEYELAESRLERMEEKLEILRAEEFNRIQEETDGLAIGRTKRRVKTTETVQNYQEEIHQMRQIVAGLEALVESLKDRRQMLIQIAKRQQSEADHY